MNKKGIIGTIFVLTIFFVLADAPTNPTITYPNSTGIIINTSTELNWSASTDADNDIIKYNLFYSNNSGTTWTSLLLNYGYENKLNDSNTARNLSFSGNQNQTIYISIPKAANITNAVLNLTGFFIPPFTKAYDSFLDEDEGDDSATFSYDALSFGRFVSAEGIPIDLYFLIYSPSDANISKIELLLGGQSRTPYNASIIYNVYIAETDSYLSGDPIDDNTTSYTLLKSNFNMSDEWGDINNVFANISLDTAYTMDSSKKYLFWFEHVSSATGRPMYGVKFDDDITNNFVGHHSSFQTTSHNYLQHLRLWRGASSNVSETWIEVGHEDGDYEWNQTGNFATTNQTNDFASVLQSYIDNNCSVELWENCTIPIKIHSNTSGILGISSINIQYTDYWWNTTDIAELTTYKINITPTDGTSNGTSDISDNDFTISHFKPNTTLNTPNTSYSNDSSDPINVEFNCSATDDWNLKNISLYITNANNNSFSLNHTTNISGTSNSTNWTLNLSNGNYTWNCISYDLAGNFDWNINKTIKINYTAPTSPASTSSSSSGGGSGGSSSSKFEFDVKIIKFNSPIEAGNFFNFTYYIKSVGTINGDVLVEFWVERENILVSSGQDVIYFGVDEEKTETTQLFIPSASINNSYGFYVQASYSNYKANASRTIEIIFPEQEPVKKPTTKVIKKPQGKIHGFSIADWGVNFVKKNDKYFLIGICTIILIIALILILKTMKKNKDHINGLKRTKKLKVFSDAIELGNIKEVYLKKNKIYEWEIKPKKKIFKKIRKKKIRLKHKYIMSIGDVMIVDKKVVKKLDLG